MAHNGANWGKREAASASNVENIANAATAKVKTFNAPVTAKV